MLFHRKHLCHVDETNPPDTSSRSTTRQVTQITYAAIYKHLGQLSVTLYSSVSTSPHHIFFHQMYANARRTISTLDQFSHMLPQAVYCITTPRYYFQRNHFHFLFEFTILQYPHWHLVVKNGNLTLATVRAHIATSTGRCTPFPTSSGRSTGLKNLHIYVFGYANCNALC